MNEAPIYVVVTSTGGEGFSGGFDGGQKHPGGPLVVETEVGTWSTLDKARERAAAFERRFGGACRIGRLIFEDHPSFAEEGKST